MNGAKTRKVRGAYGAVGLTVVPTAVTQSRPIGLPVYDRAGPTPGSAWERAADLIARRDDARSRPNGPPRPAPRKLTAVTSGTKQLGRGEVRRAEWSRRADRMHDARWGVVCEVGMSLELAED